MKPQTSDDRRTALEQFEKVERIPASIQVVNIIKAAMQSGKLKVGDRLPNETELSKEFGVGRSSLREGMRILAAYGVVEIRQGDGTYVVNRFAEHVFEFMGFLPNRENLIYMADMRRVMETGCARLIYDKLSDAQCDELERLSLDICPGGNTENNIEVDTKFHHKLIAYTKNPLLIETYHMMSAMTDAMMKTLMGCEDIASDARKAHLAICQALRHKDPDQLYAAIDWHLRKVAEYSREYISK